MQYSHMCSKRLSELVLHGGGGQFNNIEGKKVYSTTALRILYAQWNLRINDTLGTI